MKTFSPLRVYVLNFRRRLYPPNHVWIIYTPRPMNAAAQKPSKTGDAIIKILYGKRYVIRQKESITNVLIGKGFVDTASGSFLTSSEDLDAVKEKDNKY